MSGFPNSPRVLKAGLVLVDPKSGAIGRIISLQYNPDSLSRSFEVQAHGGDAADRSSALRLKGPAIESYKLEAVLDAADQLEHPEAHETAVQHGIQPQLASLELLIHPTSAQLLASHALADSGALEIAPIETPLAVFVWSKSRVVPVRITELSITEEAFDPALNPVRAKVSLGLRVLSVTDLGFAHRGGSLFMSYLQAREQLARKVAAGDLAAFGIGGIG